MTPRNSRNQNLITDFAADLNTAEREGQVATSVRKPENVINHFTVLKRDNQALQCGSAALASTLYCNSNMSVGEYAAAHTGHIRQSRIVTAIACEDSSLMLCESGSVQTFPQIVCPVFKSRSTHIRAPICARTHGFRACY